MGSSMSLCVGTHGKLLMEDAKCGQVGLVESLVKRRPALLLYHTFKESSTPWHVAAKHGHVAVLKSLVSTAKDVVAVNWALFRREADSAEEFVRALVNSRDDRHQTALMLAAIHGHADCVQYLLSEGADPWVPDRLGCRTALHYAARHNHPDCVELLLKFAGPNTGEVVRPNRREARYVDVRTSCGYTPLHHAAIGDAPSVVEILCSYGASLTFTSMHNGMDWIRCNSGSTALHLAALKNHQSVAKALIQAHLQYWAWTGATDPRLALDRTGKAPFQCADLAGHGQLADLLHPSTPVSSIFTQEELYSWCGVRPLQYLASEALRRKLTHELDTIESTIGPGGTRYPQPKVALAYPSGGGSDGTGTMSSDELTVASSGGSDQLFDTGGPSAACGACPSHPGSWAGSSGGLVIPRRSRGEEGWWSQTSGEVGSVSMEQGNLASSFSHSEDLHFDGGLPAPSSTFLSTPSSLGSLPQLSLTLQSGLKPAASGSLLEECGVCLDKVARVTLTTCGHCLCADCALHLIAYPRVLPGTCPFCRSNIGGFA